MGVDTLKDVWEGFLTCTSASTTNLLGPRAVGTLHPTSLPCPMDNVKDGSWRVLGDLTSPALMGSDLGTFRVSFPNM